MNLPTTLHKTKNTLRKPLKRDNKIEVNLFICSELKILFETNCYSML